MEKQLSAKRSQKSSNKKPVKVVYISNPMKIKASPSEFRAVVQQLTGRYATSWSSHELPGVAKKDTQEDDDDDEFEETAGCVTGGHVHHQHKCHRRPDLSYESGCREDHQGAVMDDFVITPQMLDAFSPLMPSD